MSERDGELRSGGVIPSSALAKWQRREKARAKRGWAVWWRGITNKREGEGAMPNVNHDEQGADRCGNG